MLDWIFYLKAVYVSTWITSLWRGYSESGVPWMPTVSSSGQPAPLLQQRVQHRRGLLLLQPEKTRWGRDGAERNRVTWGIWEVKEDDKEGIRALQFKSEVGTFKIKRFKACLSLVNSFWFHKTNILVDHSLKNHKNHDSHVLIKSVCVCPTKHPLDSTHWRLLYINYEVFWPGQQLHLVVVCRLAGPYSQHIRILRISLRFCYSF